MSKSIAALCFVLFAGQAFAVEVADVAEKEEGRLYFTGPGYTINLIPQAILLGLLSFLAVYFLGIDLFGAGATASGVSGYDAPEPSYSPPAPSYSAPAASYDAPAASYSAAGRYYDTYNQEQAQYEEARKKRSAF
jgi:hypothetical protein